MATTRFLQILARAAAWVPFLRPFARRRAAAVRARRLSEIDRTRLRRNLSGILRSEAA